MEDKTPGEDIDELLQGMRAIRNLPLPFERIEHAIQELRNADEARLHELLRFFNIAVSGALAKPYTSEPPTEPGWYWFRLRDGDEDVLVGGDEEVVLVFDRGGDLFWEALGEHPDDYASVDQRGFEWSGPLKPPA